MRLASITNWAYGATVALTLVSGTTMVLASNAIDEERALFERQHRLEIASLELEEEALVLSERARQYLNSGDASYLTAYRHELENLGTVEQRVEQLAERTANQEELEELHEAVGMADLLHDQQEVAIAAFERGEERTARQIMFGAEYERELDRVVSDVRQATGSIETRLREEVEAAHGHAAFWRTIAEIAMAITGIVFLCVLYFVFKRRVVQRVVKLSDVIKRLADQDFAAELPDLGHVDEIGDMAQAIAAFRDNGLERQRLEEERAADRSVRDLISRMTQRMQTCDNMPDLLAIVRRFVPQIAPDRSGRLYLLDPLRNRVVEACDWLDPRLSVPEFPPNACWGLRRGVAHRPSGEAMDVPCEHLQIDGATMPDVVCLPLMAQREVVGLLYLERREDIAAPAGGSDVYFDILAENIGMALANLRLRERLEELAMVDPLTGLANRRQLDSWIEGMGRDTARGGEPLGCVMLDVDHFKRFNDTFGHDAGDAVLREVGRVLSEACSDGERAFRYGGEEFVVVLPGIEGDHALAWAEELRQRVAGMTVNFGGRDLGAISISLGVASLANVGQATALVPAADAALLRAKERGRNRVEVDRRQDERRVKPANAA